MARKTIVALYDRRGEAEAQRNALLDAGFDDLTVDVVFDGGFGGSNDGHGGLWCLLTGWGVPGDEAHIYAEAVRLGGALLVVSLTRGNAVARALAILGPAQEPDIVQDGNLGTAAAAMRGVNAAPAAPATPPQAVPAQAPRAERVRSGVYPAADTEPGPAAVRRIQP